MLKLCCLPKDFFILWILSFLQKDEVKHFEEYRSIVPLRLLLSKRHNPERYKLTEFLMDHNENRKMYEDVWKAQRYMWNFFQLQPHITQHNFTVHMKFRFSFVFDVCCSLCLLSLIWKYFFVLICLCHQNHLEPLKLAYNIQQF